MSNTVAQYPVLKHDIFIPVYEKYVADISVIFVAKNAHDNTLQARTVLLMNVIIVQWYFCIVFLYVCETSHSREHL